MTAVSDDSITTRLLGSLDEIEALRADWEALEQATPEATGFQSFAWCRAAYLQSRTRPLVVTVRSGSRLVALWPLQRESLLGATVVRWAGEPLTQYGDALSEPGPGRSRWLQAALEAIGRHGGIDLVALTRLRADGVLATSGLDLKAGGETVAAPLIDLCGPGNKVRSHKSVARRERRLAALGPVTLEEAQTPGSREALVMLALRIKRAWLAEKGLVGSALGAPQTAALLSEMARNGVLRCFALRVGDEIAAIDLGLVGGVTYRSLLSCYEPRFAEGSPGQTLTARLITHLRGDGLAALDLLAPAEPYKLAWATRVTPLGAHFRPMTLGGHAAAWALLRLRPLAKRTVRAASPLLTAVGRGVASFKRRETGPARGAVSGAGARPLHG